MEDIFIWEYDNAPWDTDYVVDLSEPIASPGTSDILQLDIFHTSNDWLEYVGLYIAGKDKEELLRWATETTDASGYGLEMRVGALGTWQRFTMASGSPSAPFTVYQRTTDNGLKPGDRISLYFRMNTPGFLEKPLRPQVTFDLIYVRRV